MNFSWLKSHIVRGALALCAGWLSLPALSIAQTDAAKASEQDEGPIVNSDLNAKMMFFVLMAEYSAIRGDFGAAADYYFQVAREYKREELYAKAVEYSIQHGSADKLLRIGSSWVMQQPLSPKANLTWLTVLIRLNQHGNTESALKNTLSVSDLRTRQAILIELSKLYGGAAFLPASIAMVEKVVAPYAIEPETAIFAKIGLGRLKLLAKDTVGASQALTSLSPEDQRTPMAFAYANVLLQSGVPEAKPWILKSLETSTDISQLLAFLQWQQRNEGLRASLQTASALALQHPNNPELGLVLAELQIRGSRWSAAETTLAKAARSIDGINAKLPEATAALVKQQIRLKQADVALKLKKPQQVEALLADVSDTRFDDSLLAVRLALHVQKGHWDAAKALLDQAPEREDFGEREKRSLYLSVLKDQKQYAKALALVSLALSAEPDNRALLVQQASLMDSAGDTESAIKAFKTLASQYPDDAEIQNALGFTLANSGQELESAKAMISKANEAQVGNAMIIDSMGWVQFKLGNLKDAVGWLELAHSLDLDPEIAAHLGETFWAVGRKEDAMRTWAEAYDRAAPHPVLAETLMRLKVSLP
jgi:tetratricopeptide (TPR) repeat protein